MDMMLYYSFIKRLISITLGSDPSTLEESYKNILYFLVTRQFFEHFLKKMFFASEKAENNWKPHPMSTAPLAMLAVTHTVLATAHGGLRYP